MKEFVVYKDVNVYILIDGYVRDNCLLYIETQAIHKLTGIVWCIMACYAYIYYVIIRFGRISFGVWSISPKSPN